jgi:hypothetical protein
VVKSTCCDPPTKSKTKSSDCCQDCCSTFKTSPAIVPPPVSLQNLTEPAGEFLTVAELGLASLVPDRSSEVERPPPFLSVEAKLFAHHVLRC